jgi:PadR family transcriptional regulator PadR
VGIRGGTGAGARSVPDGQGFATGVWSAQAAGGPVEGGSAEEGARSGVAPAFLGLQTPAGGPRECLTEVEGPQGLTRVISSCSLRILGMGRKAHKNDSLPGSLDMLILRTLLRRDLHGYGIVQFIQQSSENELLVEEGSLYPALQRLELNGWIGGIWGVTSNNRRAKIYKITAAGRKQLAVETRKYAKLTLAIARVMGVE